MTTLAKILIGLLLSISSCSFAARLQIEVPSETQKINVPQEQGSEMEPCFLNVNN